MFTGTNTLYFSTIRKITGAFGSLFSNIYVFRYDYDSNNTLIKLQNIKVPLMYGDKKKYNTLIQQARRDGNTVRLNKVFPRISYKLSGLQYNGTRKLPTLNATYAKDVDDVSTLLKQLNPVPYDFNFTLSIGAKYIDDALQIIEQILPNFTPSYNIEITDIPELSLQKDLPVILGGISPDIETIGQFEDEEIIEFTLDFVVKGYLYPQINNPEIIKKVISRLYNDENFEQDSIGNVVVSVNPIDSEVDDSWDYLTEINETDSNGDLI